MSDDPTIISLQLAAAGRVASHTHVETDVASLTSDLAGKAAATHTHVEADVASLVADLAGKAAASHIHAESDVTGLATDLAGRVSAPASGRKVNGGSADVTTNASGVATITHSLGVTPVTAVGNVVGAASQAWVTVSNLTSTTFDVTVWTTAGTANNSARTINWVAFG